MVGQNRTKTFSGRRDGENKFCSAFPLKGPFTLLFASTSCLPLPLPPLSILPHTPLTLGTDDLWSAHRERQNSPRNNLQISSTVTTVRARASFPLRFGFFNSNIMFVPLQTGSGAIY